MALSTAGTPNPEEAPPAGANLRPSDSERTPLSPESGPIGREWPTDGTRTTAWRLRVLASPRLSEVLARMWNWRPPSSCPAAQIEASGLVGPTRWARLALLRGPRELDCAAFPRVGEAKPHRRHRPVDRMV